MPSITDAEMQADTILFRGTIVNFCRIAAEYIDEPTDSKDRQKRAREIENDLKILSFYTTAVTAGLSRADEIDSRKKAIVKFGTAARDFTKSTKIIISYKRASSVYGTLRSVFPESAKCDKGKIYNPATGYCE